MIIRRCNMCHKTITIQLDYDGVLLITNALMDYKEQLKKNALFLNSVNKPSQYNTYLIELCDRLYWYIRNNYD